MRWRNSLSRFVPICALLLASCRSSKQVEQYEDININRLNNIRQITAWGIILDDTITISVLDTVHGQWVQRHMVARKTHVTGGDTMTTKQKNDYQKVSKSTKVSDSNSYKDWWLLLLFLVIMLVVVVFLRFIGI